VTVIWESGLLRLPGAVRPGSVTMTSAAQRAVEPTSWLTTRVGGRPARVPGRRQSVTSPRLVRESASRATVPTARFAELCRSRALPGGEPRAASASLRSCGPWACRSLTTPALPWVRTVGNLLSADTRCTRQAAEDRVAAAASGVRLCAHLDTVPLHAPSSPCCPRGLEKRQRGKYSVPITRPPCCPAPRSHGHVAREWFHRWISELRLAVCEETALRRLARVRRLAR